MSLSVSGSSNNPFANLQYLLQQDASQSGATNQSNPLSALIGGAQPNEHEREREFGPARLQPLARQRRRQRGGFPQFDPQTLQALLAAQMSANGVSSPPSWSQFGGAGAGQQSGSAWWQQSGQGDGGMMGGASGSGRLDGLLQTIAAADVGATSQSTSNANGSTTTTITYADGSSLSMTSAPTSSECRFVGQFRHIEQRRERDGKHHRHQQRQRVEHDDHHLCGRVERVDYLAASFG